MLRCLELIGRVPAHATVLQRYTLVILAETLGACTSEESVLAVKRIKRTTPDQELSLLATALKLVLPKVLRCVLREFSEQ